MTKTCCICKASFSAPYRNWFEDLVPRVCSSRCYLEWLDMVSRTSLAPFDWKKFPDALKHADRRSGYERAYERWLIESQISYVYEPYSFELNGLMYVPDYLLNLGTFVEIKGQWGQRDKSKIRRFIKTGMHLHVVDGVFLKELERGRRANSPKYHRTI